MVREAQKHYYPTCTCAKGLSNQFCPWDMSSQKTSSLSLAMEEEATKIILTQYKSIALSI